jgi:cytochrome c biogenesis protein CcdA
VSTRHLVAYLLILILLVGMALVFWRVVYMSDRNVQRRLRRQRRAQRRPAEAEETPE